MPAGPRVLDDTAAAFEASGALRLAERLIVAMEAGEAAGGDKRGKQAAALILYSTESYPALDLRVDDHPEPIVELRALREEPRAIPAVHGLPARRDDPAGVTDRAVIEAAVERFAGGAITRPRRPLKRVRARDAALFEIAAAKTSASHCRRTIMQTALRIVRIGFALAWRRSRRAPAQTLRIGLAEDPDVLDPTLGALVRRTHRFRGAVRQALRHRREARHRPAARERRTSGRRTAKL